MNRWWEWFVSVLLSVGTFLFGTWTASRSERLRSRESRLDRIAEGERRRLDREADEIAREKKIRDRIARKRSENQLLWLVELQEVISDFMRAIGEIEHTDLSVIRASGRETVRLPAVGEELSERTNVLQRRAIILASRIDSERVRESVTEIWGHYSHYLYRPEVSRAEVIQRATAIASACAESNELIGDGIRSVYRSSQ